MDFSWAGKYLKQIGKTRLSHWLLSGVFLCTSLTVSAGPFDTDPEHKAGETSTEDPNQTKINARFVQLLRLRKSKPVDYQRVITKIKQDCDVATPPPPCTIDNPARLLVDEFVKNEGQKPTPDTDRASADDPANGEDPSKRKVKNDPNAKTTPPAIPEKKDDAKKDDKKQTEDDENKVAKQEFDPRLLPLLRELENARDRDRDKQRQNQAGGVQPGGTPGGGTPSGTPGGQPGGQPQGSSPDFKGGTPHKAVDKREAEPSRERFQVVNNGGGNENNSSKNAIDELFQSFKEPKRSAFDFDKKSKAKESQEDKKKEETPEKPDLETLAALAAEQEKGGEGISPQNKSTPQAQQEPVVPGGLIPGLEDGATVDAGGAPKLNPGGGGTGTAQGEGAGGDLGAWSWGSLFNAGVDAVSGAAGSGWNAVSSIIYQALGGQVGPAESSPNPLIAFESDPSKDASGKNRGITVQGEFLPNDFSGADPRGILIYQGAFGSSIMGLCQGKNPPFICNHPKLKKKPGVNKGEPVV